MQKQYDCCLIFPNGVLRNLGVKSVDEFVFKDGSIILKKLEKIENEEVYVILGVYPIQYFTCDVI